MSLTLTRSEHADRVVPEQSLAPDGMWSRAELIAYLEQKVHRHEAAGAYPRAAIRATASETGLHPLRVKRLTVLFPEA